MEDSNRSPAIFRVEELSDVSAEKVERAQTLISKIAQLEDANILYLRCFQLLKLGGLEAEIPRLVVFGQQSTGKTTLLDYVMGGPIGYSSTTTGTKQPVVIMLKPSDNGKVSCCFDGQELEIKQLQEAMRETMQKAGENISSNELEVEISVPGGVHAVFVDLPGIKDDSKAGAQLTRSVVKGYVQNNPNDLYVLVKKASDDPANWPWSLREFILTGPPKGLGLTPRQTVVVGTRAKEFLNNEKNDIRSQDQLVERVAKRAVKDAHNNPLPLFILELFSLSLDVKESLSFAEKKMSMNNQINEGRAEVLEILTSSFEAASSVKKQQELLDYFDVEKFRKELNVKFQSLLNEQLSLLERRLIRKRIETQNRIGELEDQLSQQTPQSVRESIKLYLRELLETVTELVTGNYTIIRLPEAGDRFLNTFGGSLSDNLSEGHQLATELFPDPQQYDPSFLSTIMSETEELFTKMDAMAKNESAGSFNLGMSVRFVLSRDETCLLGTIYSLSEEKPEEVAVNFYFKPIIDESIEENITGDQSQTKTVDSERLTELKKLPNNVNIPVDGLPCWKRHYRKDGWVGLENVYLIAVENSEEGIITCGNEPNSSNITVKLQELYIDSSNKNSRYTRRNSVHLHKSTLSVMQRVAGEYAESKVLNQLSMTHLGRWLKFHICNLEPDRRFSEDVLLQMMRSVRHIIDKADWEPLVADLLQANVRGGMLHVARLAACAAACAMRKILRAACSEVFRHIQAGDLNIGLNFLATNPRFIEELETSLELYCRDKAMQCTNAMRDLIFEQTHAVHFEMIEDFFEGCRQFEHDFLESNDMDDISLKVRESLAMRKRRLGVADVYSRHESTGTPNSMIYEEVRMQFWVIKMLLSAPLTTKLYMHFVKDIKDKSMHLASEKNFTTSCESELERNLQESILCEKSCSGKLIPRTDEELMSYYNLLINKDDLRYKISAAQRTEQYVKMALEAVSRLRQQIHKKTGVDFLMRLDLNASPV